MLFIRRKKFFVKNGSKLFTRLKSLKEHNNSVHVKEKSQICKICDSEFFTPSDPNNHSENCHLNQRSSINFSLQKNGRRLMIIQFMQEKNPLNRSRKMV